MTKLFGTVLVDSAPASDVTVEIHNSVGDVVDQVRTNEGGNFTYYLSAGDWSLRSWDAHGRRGDVRVSIAENDKTKSLRLAIS